MSLSYFDLGNIQFTDELPKSPVGKILRRLIKEADQKEHGW